MLIIIGIMAIWGIIAYLIILGGSKSKSDYERKMEDEEQMRWLMDNRRKK